MNRLNRLANESAEKMAVIMAWMTMGGRPPVKQVYDTALLSRYNAIRQAVRYQRNTEGKE